MREHDEFDLDVRLTSGSKMWASQQQVLPQVPSNGGQQTDCTCMTDCYQNTQCDSCVTQCNTCYTQCGQDTCQTCDTQCGQNTCALTCTCDTQCPDKMTCYSYNYCQFTDPCYTCAENNC